MELNLQQSVDFILNSDNLPALRATELFAFLVALHLGDSRVKVSQTSRTDATSSLALDVSNEILRAARLLSAMKFLDRIEQDWKEKNGEALLLSELVKIPEYEAIMTRVIFVNGSWRTLRFVYSVRALEKKLRRWKRKARYVGRIIEFSFRFEPNPKKPRHLGGVTMATDIVTSVPYFKVGLKKTRLEESWSSLQSAAPFFYLIYIQRYGFFLKNIAGKRFAERFLAMVSDREHLLDFFADYNSLIEVLRRRGYRYSPIILPPGTKKRPLHRDPFSERKAGERAVVDEIASYRKS